MEKQNVIVTGCSSGIGLCIARELHRAGFTVYPTVRAEKDRSIFDNGMHCEVLDLDSSDSIKNAVSSIAKRTQGNIYGLVNNGAYGQPGAVEDLPRQALVEQFQTNVFGTQELTNLIIPYMRKQGQGRIVQISSILGFVCLKYRGAYNASKFALEGLTDTMRLELAGSGIKLSLVEPGPITSKFRVNALQKFRQYIDAENSLHKAAYEGQEKRMTSDEPVRFTLPAEAVAKPVIHALQSNNPKVRYRVTVPTRIMAPLKRILPDKLMDRVLAGS